MIGVKTMSNTINDVAFMHEMVNKINALDAEITTATSHYREAMIEHSQAYAMSLQYKGRDGNPGLASMYNQRATEASLKAQEALGKLSSLAGESRDCKSIIAQRIAVISKNVEVMMAMGDTNTNLKFSHGSSTIKEFEKIKTYLVQYNHMCSCLDVLISKASSAEDNDPTQKVKRIR